MGGSGFMGPYRGGEEKEENGENGGNKHKTLENIGNALDNLVYENGDEGRRRHRR